MKSFRNKLILLATLIATTAVAHQDDTDVSRLTLVHPDLGHEGGSALHTKIRNLYTRVGDNVATRYQEYTAVANSTVTTLTHGLGVPFADIVVVLYSGVAPSKTRIVDPVAAGWTIAAGGTPTTQVAVTAPSSGGPHSFAVEVYEGLGSVAVQDADSVNITGGTLANFVLDNYMDVNEEASPSTPASGKIRVYGKTDKKVYKKDSTGLETELGGSSGSGEINVIGNPNESTNWLSTGAGVTVATTTTSTDLPLGGVVTTAIKITPVSGTTDYAYYCWTQPASLKNRKLKLSQEQRPLSGYASGDLKLDVYSYATASCGGAATRVNLSTDTASVTGIPNATGRFTTTFDADSSDFYGIRYTRVAGTTALNITSVIVGPGIQPQGVAGEYLGPFATVSGHSTNVQAQGGNYWRNSDRMIVSGSIEFSGVNTEGILAPVLPTGFTVDTAKLFSGYSAGAAGDFIVLGGWSFRDDSSPNDTYDGQVVWDVSAGGFRLQKPGGTASVVDTASNTPVTIGDDDAFQWRFEVPISNWSGSGSVNLAQNDVEYAYNTDVTDAANTSAFGYGPAGTPFPGSTFTAARNKTVRFQTPISSSDVISMEIQPLGAGTDGWVPLVGSGTAASTNVQGLVLQNATYYGAGIHSVSSSTDVIVRLGQYAFASGATYAAAGTNWDGTSDNYRWRLKKSKGGIAVGFGKADAVSSGLLPSNTIGKNLTTAPVFDGTVPGDSLITAAMLAAGGVVQYASDGSGTCWRYEVGLQICTGTATGNLTVNTATGSLFRSADTTWTYALAFSATPVFLGTATRSAAADNQPAYIGAQSSPGTSSASYNVVSTASNSGQGWNRRFFAIGLWK